MIERSDWPLIALSEAEDERLTPIQMQKVLFLIAENLHPGSDYYKFEPYHYGPFDRRIYDDLEDQAHNGLCRRVSSSEHAGHDYELTPMGRRRAERVRHELPKEQRDYTKRLVRWAKDLTFRQLVTAIYRDYPQYGVRSVFRD